MKPIPLLLASLLLGTAACAQEARSDLYDCEGCEALDEHSSEPLGWETTIPADAGEPLVLRGTVYQSDGTTPAPGVIVYAYHTNADGVYAAPPGATGWGRRHGALRGWVKTDGQGRYRFRTIRPAPYPGGTDPAHIHLTVKEPGHRAYWIDEVVFEDDPLLTPAYRRAQQGRGGTGVVALGRDAQGVWQGTRDIVLERHPEGR